MKLEEMIPEPWREILEEEFQKPYIKSLEAFLDEEYANLEIYPPEDKIFSAFEHTPYEEVKVLLLGQDPYHGPGQAHGLSFSVQKGVTPPPSLKNMFKELHDDLGYPIPKNGNLIPWANQGVMLLNAVLTVRKGSPNSHKGKGWEKFTDTVIQKLSERDELLVFLLWGAYAQKKIKLIDVKKHEILKSAHPSPLSAANGFFGSRPYSQINDILTSNDMDPIDWQILNNND